MSGRRPSWAEAVQILRASVDAGHVPGAAAQVRQAGEIVLEEVYGCASWVPERRPIPPDPVFDLASVTKVVATTTAVMLLYQRGGLDLDAPVAQYLPEFGPEDKAEITPRHLLTHTSGFPAWIPFYEQHGSLEAIFAAVCATPLEAKPNERCTYSDLEFITLGVLVERLAGQPLDVFCRDHIFAPLGLRDTTFNPPAAWQDRFMATEDCPWRGRVVRGEVHDENAYACGGVAGHAGLFGTARDLGVFLQALLEAYQGHPQTEPRFVLTPATVATLLTRQPGPAETKYALGWGWCPHYGEGKHAASPEAFGHTGFTGTQVFVDPARHLTVVLLTNRVHPSRQNQKIAELRSTFLGKVLEIAAQRG